MYIAQTSLHCNFTTSHYSSEGVLGVPNGSTMTPGEGRNRKLNSELANGRLVTWFSMEISLDASLDAPFFLVTFCNLSQAMMAIIGMFFQAVECP